MSIQNLFSICIHLFPKTRAQRVVLTAFFPFTASAFLFHVDKLRQFAKIALLLLILRDLRVQIKWADKLLYTNRKANFNGPAHLRSQWPIVWGHFLMLNWVRNPHPAFERPAGTPDECWHKLQMSLASLFPAYLHCDCWRCELNLLCSWHAATLQYYSRECLPWRETSVGGFKAKSWGEWKPLIVKSLSAL